MKIPIKVLKGSGITIHRNLNYRNLIKKQTVFQQWGADKTDGIMHHAAPTEIYKVIYVGRISKAD